MKIDGRAIADQILSGLQKRISALKRKGVIPTLAVIQVGDDPGSAAYIRQKQKAAEYIGAKLIVSHQSSAISLQTLQNISQQYGDDQSVHGIIVQRPLPDALRAPNILLSKDVDGFLPNSPYPVPVAEAVLKILESTFSASTHSRINALTTKHIVVIGRGETAGKPIADTFIKMGCMISVIHSQTPNPDRITKNADIVVSCVGKPNVVRRDNIKQGAILISVGLWRDSDGKLHGDYEEDDIQEMASFYTPTPGGVGPVNVACLMANLYRSCFALPESVQLS
ncbi:bifunctional 5,10-methylenetetrahydrofolate dehydrogenase/5,10-methenyltetrahydrofolate cyclohydrolase [Candidatus Gottesmanbacteria bacterium]|nr:bifunctional 5,10-methylenetetrahydrofolate dehydrogenase/5,10-methenyltetrahydrofolate cyclohydrolase [Candidatus Gottesmanbacteria bacterium]